MTAFVRRIWAVPAAERRLQLETALALIWARLVLALLPFPAAMRWHGLGLEFRPGGDGDGAAAREIGQRVARVARRLPLGAVCLHQAVAASGLLRRRGLPAEVHFGLTRSAEGALVAHAWCTSAGVAVTGTAEAGEYTRVAVYDTWGGA